MLFITKTAHISPHESRTWYLGKQELDTYVWESEKKNAKKMTRIEVVEFFLNYITRDNLIPVAITVDQFPDFRG